MPRCRSETCVKCGEKFCVVLLAWGLDFLLGWKVLRRIELSPNSGKATLYLGSRDGSDTISRAGHQCYRVHAVGPKTRTKPAHAKVLDYYRPHVKDTQMYTIPEDCPSRIVHDSGNYHASDNLFNKAKSLTDSEEILITHEFSFEDIPEGIPLEDPLYDNLTKRNKNEDKVIQKSSNQNKVTDNKILHESVKDENKIIKEYEHVMNLNPDATDLNQSKNQKLTRNESIKDGILLQNNISGFANSNKKTDSNKNTKDENDIPKKNDFLTNIYKDNGNEYTNIALGLNDSFKGINFTKFEENNHETKNKNNEVEKQRDDLISKENNKTIDIQTHSKVSNELTRDAETKGYNKNEVEGDLRVENNDKNSKVDNPSLTDFHVINSEKDLDFPTGVEGPIPAIVLPPKSFVAPLDIGFPIPNSQLQSSWRRYSEIPFNLQYYQPLYNKQNYYINYRPVLPPHK